jgi:hypothetical protein
MPKSSITHTVDITFTLDEIMDLLRERADHISAVNKMVYNSATFFMQKELITEPICSEEDVPHFVLHFISEAS